MSFAGIGAIVVCHFGAAGAGATPGRPCRATCCAVAVCAVVGALVALPALRLRGLYLALATWPSACSSPAWCSAEIAERELLRLHGSHFFPAGSLTMPRPSSVGSTSSANAPFLMLVTVVFALIGICLVACAAAHYGRRSRR